MLSIIYKKFIYIFKIKNAIPNFRKFNFNLKDRRVIKFLGGILMIEMLKNLNCHSSLFVVL